jgi:hypothetical protein
MRKFIRHPVNIPIEVNVTEHITSEIMPKASDLGSGGLSFHYNQYIEPGTLVCIKIPYTKPAFETDAKVVWCRKRSDGTELGVEFLSADDAFKTRMIEQICHIENYKHAVNRNEGRNLTVEEVANEWVNKYAADFPK